MFNMKDVQEAHERIKKHINETSLVITKDLIAVFYNEIG